MFLSLLNTLQEKKSNKVLVQVCDKNYLEHAKYLFANAKSIGQWDGDYCLIVNNVDKKDLTSFEGTNIIIYHTEYENPYYAKLEIFDVFFKTWDYVLYMDQDIAILKDIGVEDPPSTATIYADIDGPFKIQQYFCHGWPDYKRRAAIDELLPKYPFIQNLGYNAGCLYVNTSLIKLDTKEELQKLKQELIPINTHGSIGTDQPIINIYFYYNISPDLFCSFWRTPEDQMKKAIHFCHGEAPWINNTYSSILKKTYKDHYSECLLSFNKLFKN